MELLLYHPGASRIPCAMCKDWLYDIKTGERTVTSGDDRQPCRRPKIMNVPCVDDPRRPGQPPVCPKDHFTKEKQVTLSDKNWRTLEIYLEMRASGGANLTKAMRRDRLLMKNMAIVDSIYRGFERYRLAETIARQLPVLKLA